MEIAENNQGTSENTNDIAVKTNFDNTSLQSSQIAFHEYYQGFLPHPSILLGYEKIKPGFSEKVFNVYEKEVQHRR